MLFIGQHPMNAWLVFNLESLKSASEKFSSVKEVFFGCFVRFGEKTKAEDRGENSHLRCFKWLYWLHLHENSIDFQSHFHSVWEQKQSLIILWKPVSCKLLSLPVDWSTCSHLWPWALGSDQTDPVTDKRRQNEHSSQTEGVSKR